MRMASTVAARNTKSTPESSDVSTDKFDECPLSKGELGRATWGLVS